MFPFQQHGRSSTRADQLLKEEFKKTTNKPLAKSRSISLFKLKTNKAKTK